MIRSVFGFLALTIGGMLSLSAKAFADDSGQVPFYTYRIVNTFPHDAESFTQGLFIQDGVLYESTGRYGESRLHKVTLDTGEHVHSHNLRTTLSGSDEYIYIKNSDTYSDDSSNKERHFMGYRRSDGRVGTRNEIWILSTVGCVSRMSEKIARQANAHFSDSACEGVFAFTHPFGCSQVSDDLEGTQKITAALAQHPNAGGVLIVGLGCENNQGKQLLELIPEEYHRKIRFFNCQASHDEIAEGLAYVDELVKLSQQDKRLPCPL